jgi:hypothetical protein
MRSLRAIVDTWNRHGEPAAICTLADIPGPIDGTSNPYRVEVGKRRPWWQRIFRRR